MLFKDLKKEIIKLEVELEELQLCLCNSLIASECKISPSLVINALLCKKGISCERLEGCDRGTALFKATAKSSCG